MARLRSPLPSMLEAAGTVSKVRKREAHPEADSNLCDTWGHALPSPKDALVALVVQWQKPCFCSIPRNRSCCTQVWDLQGCSPRDSV